jgi:hypothetical protein
VIKIYKTLLLISLIFSFPAYSFHMTVSSNCNNGATPYNFDKFSYKSDIKIKFSSYAFNPDYRFKELTSKNGADIVITDHGVGDFSVCKSYQGKSIKISNYGFDSDLTIKISKYEYSPDYNIFNDSKFLTTEEAISIILLQDFENQN